LKGCFRNLIEEVFEHHVEGGLIFGEKFHLLEEEDDDIDKDQAAQAQAEDLEVFSYEISMKDTMTLKHLPKSLSVSVE